MDAPTDIAPDGQLNPPEQLNQPPPPPPQQQQQQQEQGDEPGAEELEAFRCDVRTWMELDTTIGVLRDALRERRAAKEALTPRITQFMARYNIDDLATRNGRLRMRVAYTRPSLSPHTVRERIATFYADDLRAAQQLSSVVLGGREQRSERTCLRRLGGTAGSPGRGANGNNSQQP